MKSTHSTLFITRRILRVSGSSMALPFVAWLVVGWLPGIPSIIDVFGVTGLKIPARRCHRRPADRRRFFAYPFPKYSVSKRILAR
ncbi:hypothetical protein [Thiohalophilus sp.]|uniref:hypothetical protein n=1 Tax=Thiohalophilus sp. TaxID=3028392 RepID=UPI002ACD7ABA|nr:hypothetical protein [Thiohalophilus sp.]MDZ7804963.1 hypothetical protein [Thiohalophilus sp.]